MITLAIATTNSSRAEVWWCALGADAVVIACVVILLTLLSAFVRDIERALALARIKTAQTAEHLAESTLIPEAADLIKQLAGELQRQNVAVGARAEGAS